MVYYLPIISAAALAGGTILERFILMKKKIGIESYQTASFLSTVIFIIPFLFFFWKLDPQALALGNILIFACIVILAIIANLFYFYSLTGEKVGNLEPAIALEPLFVIILTLVFSLLIGGIYSTSSRVIIPAIIASLALAFSHIEKHHLKFSKYFISMVLGSFFFALELVISALVLNYYSPFTFYFLRCLFVFALSLMFFSPSFKEFDNKSKWITFMTGGIWVVYRVLLYYGYLKIGIVFTTLLIMLGPIFIYLFARIFLKEKLKWKNIAAAVIIIAAIIYALA